MEAARRKAAIILTDLRGLTIVALLTGLLLHPSMQLPLIRGNGAQQRAGPGDVEGVSAQGKLVAGDNTASLQASSLLRSFHHRHHHHHRAHVHARSSSSSTTSDSTHTVSFPRRTHSTTTRPANPRKKTNGGGENFRSPHQFVGETPTESPSRKASSAEDTVTRNSADGGSTQQKEKSSVKTGRGKLHRSSGSVSDKSFDRHPLSAVDQAQRGDVEFTEVVQVEAAQTAASSQIKADGVSSSTDSGGESETVQSVVQKEVVVLVEKEGERQSLQQPVPAHRSADPHVSKMVLTAIGSLTAVVGVCVMAAIFQCCCRRKRSGSSPDNGHQQQELDKKGLQEQHKGGGSSSSRSSRSKSPSPQKALTKDEEEEPEKGYKENDALLDEDKDLGDFSMVQRETTILRSYRKPPPPKNRARASRVPRALKGVDPKASPNIFQELVDSEQKEDSGKTPGKATNGLASSEPKSSDMESSMLADIDSTLAALHTDHDPSPSLSRDRSREASAEKQLEAKTGAGTDTASPQKTSTKQALPTSSSKEQFAKALAQELSRSREMLSKPQSKPVTPKGSKDTTPKSQSAGASPKTVHSENSSASSSKDNMGSSNGGETTAGKLKSSPEESNKKIASSNKDSTGSGSGGENGAGKSVSEEGDANSNIFALIDPTAKDKGNETGGKSKIPVRAASSPTHPTAPLRFSASRDKRFPVPSVHGDQMDQLMKSLKTRLKDDETASPKQAPNDMSIEDDSQDDSLDPQERDRSYSDPTQQQEDRGSEIQQTHL